MNAMPHRAITRDEYMDWELRQEDKHEFVDGHVTSLFPEIGELPCSVCCRVLEDLEKNAKT